MYGYNSHIKGILHIDFYAKSQFYDAKESGSNENKYDHYNRT